MKKRRKKINIIILFLLFYLTIVVFNSCLNRNSDRTRNPNRDTFVSPTHTQTTSKIESSMITPTTITSSIPSDIQTLNKKDKNNNQDYWVLPEIKYIVPSDDENTSKPIIIPSVRFNRMKKSGEEVDWKYYSEGVFNILHKGSYGGVINSGVDNYIISLMNLKKGDSIADIGAGLGTYIFKFSQLVGKKGKVYTTDLSKNSKAFIQWKKE